METFVRLVQIKKEALLDVNPSFSTFHTGYEQSSKLLAHNPAAGAVNVNYLSLSLPVVVTIGGILTNYDNGLLIGVGPYYNIAVAGNYETLGSAVYVKKQIKFGDAATDNRKRTDAGITVEMGLKVNKNLYMGLQFNRGLQNTTPSARVVNGSF